MVFLQYITDFKKKKLMSFKNTDFSFVTYQTEKCCDVCLRGAL